MRSALLLLLASPLALTVACTTTETSTGQLRTAFDKSVECRDNPGDSFSCSIQVTLEGNKLSAVGIYDTGAATGPTATGTLNPAAEQELAGLIAAFPLETEDTIHSVGCGGLPERTTKWSIDFDNGEQRTFSYEYSDDQTVRDLNDLVRQYVYEVSSCQGNHIAFGACTPNVRAQNAATPTIVTAPRL